MASIYGSAGGGVKVNQTIDIRSNKTLIKDGEMEFLLSGFLETDRTAYPDAFFLPFQHRPKLDYHSFNGNSSYSMGGADADESYIYVLRPGSTYSIIYRYALDTFARDTTFEILTHFTYARNITVQGGKIYVFRNYTPVEEIYVYDIATKALLNQLSPTDYGRCRAFAVDENYYYYIGERNVSSEKFNYISKVSRVDASVIENIKIDTVFTYNDFPVAKVINGFLLLSRGGTNTIRLIDVASGITMLKDETIVSSSYSITNIGANNSNVFVSYRSSSTIKVDVLELNFTTGLKDRIYNSNTNLLTYMRIK